MYQLSSVAFQREENIRNTNATNGRLDGRQTKYLTTLSDRKNLIKRNLFDQNSYLILLPCSHQ